MRDNYDLEMRPTWSPRALRTCERCSLIWVFIVMGTCTYLVFWKDASGWWYLLAMLLCSWDCKSYRSPEQIAADRSKDD